MGFTNIEGIVEEWDQCTELRERLRSGGKIISTPACQDITTCVSNAGLLQPLLIRMAGEKDRTLPAIDQLRDELQALLDKNKRGVDAEGTDLQKVSWAIKKLCGFMKTKARRREVSTVTRFISYIGLWAILVKMHYICIVFLCFAMFLGIQFIGLRLGLDPR